MKTLTKWLDKIKKAYSKLFKKSLKTVKKTRTTRKKK